MNYNGKLYGKVASKYIELELTTDDIEKAMKQTCVGCIHVTTDKKECYDEECESCRRFYGDEYRTGMEDDE